MPTALPGISITSAVNLMQKQDQIIRTFPEVESVFGSVGRSDSATDNAPLDMYDTTIMLKPRDQWRKGMTYDQLIAEMDDRLHFPGLSNSWTMPVENRLDMELTGIKTPVGLKIQGPDVDRIQQIGSQIEEILGPVPGTRGIFAERVSQGFYINVDVDRAVAARYGLTVGDVQRAVSSGMGGENIATTVEGRERYSINVRYLADYRNDLNALRRILIMTPTGAQIPLGEVAHISLSPGPSMIRDEDGLLTGYVYVDLATSDYGSYVDNAQRVLDRQLHLPAGYTLKWSGEYEFQLRARKRLTVILPIVFGLIFVLLYMLFQSVTEAIVLILPTVYAMTGGLLLQYMMGFNFSVAVWVGYIALFGIAVETGVVMVIYLHEALNRHIAAGELTHEEHRVGGDRGCSPAASTQADDRCSRDAQSRADSMGERNRLRRDEANRRANRRRNDHLDDSRPHTGAGVLRDHEGAGTEEKEPAVTGLQDHLTTNPAEDVRRPMVLTGAIPSIAAAADSSESQRDAAESSSTSGTSTTRARSHSPRLLAWGSGRTDEATPSPSRPTITKLSARKLGSS